MVTNSYKIALYMGEKLQLCNNLRKNAGKGRNNPLPAERIKQKNRGANPGKTWKNPLTNKKSCDKMVLHTVGSMPSVPSYPAWSVYHRLWTLSSGKFEKTNNLPGRIKK